MADLALSPVSTALYALLSADSSLQALIGTRVYDHVPAGPTFPYVWFEVEEAEARGFGTGTFPEVDLRVHAFVQAGGGFGVRARAQAIISRVKTLLQDAALTVPGFTQAGRVFYDRTVPLADEEMAGVLVHELVAFFRIFVEATP